MKTKEEILEFIDKKFYNSGKYQEVPLTDYISRHVALNAMEEYAKNSQKPPDIDVWNDGFRAGFNAAIDTLKSKLIKTGGNLIR